MATSGISQIAAKTSRIAISQLDADDDTDRAARYERAWHAYDGDGPLPFDGDQACDNVRLDYAKLIVDKGVSFLAGKGGVTFQLQPPGPEDLGDEDGDVPVPEASEEAREGLIARAEAALDRVWPEEQRHLDFHQLAQNGGICGHFWLRLYENGRVSVIDPSNVTVIWDEDDIGIVDELQLEWTTVERATGDGVVRRKRFIPDDPEDPSSWQVIDEQYNDDSHAWMATDQTTWGHPFPPLIGGQNLPSANTYYGLSDLEPATLDQIEQLESLASDMRRIARMHGHPVPVIIGQDPARLQQIDVSIGELLALPDKDARLDKLAIAELTSLLALYTELKTALFEGTRIPKIALGDTTNAGPTTGVAMQVEYEPLIEKTETKRLTYGIPLKRAAEALLALVGFPGWTVKLGWPRLLPADEAADATRDESELRMGIVSKQTVAERRGYDWDVEQQRLGEQQANTPPDSTSRLLDQLANGGGPRLPQGTPGQGGE